MRKTMTNIHRPVLSDVRGGMKANLKAIPIELNIWGMGHRRYRPFKNQMTGL